MLRVYERYEYEDSSVLLSTPFYDFRLDVLLTRLRTRFDSERVIEEKKPPPWLNDDGGCVSAAAAMCPSSDSDPGNASRGRRRLDFERRGDLLNDVATDRMDAAFEGGAGGGGDGCWKVCDGNGRAKESCATGGDLDGGVGGISLSCRLSTRGGSCSLVNEMASSS